ncbi:glycoside hydrolase domain-containing protein [Lacticaseibacillus mingshuiensis]|uniref:glycoside hydrolase domain-containing protein n=1 Tax=Lacticaseibacillus mingshuiensis TaxID=2799574 RepID=UPI001CEC557C|nr:glycoside hydrolase domain-containing protein [Lacticaseibacillus mingshuiensis]
MQNWLNDTYADVSGFEKAPTDGMTGWPTIYSLRMGLQHEIGIASLAEGFGDQTKAALIPVVPELKSGYTAKPNITKLIKGAFWCKGISPGDFTDTYGSSLVSAIEELQTDAGLTANGTVTVNLMAALFDMSAFVLVLGGDPVVRSLQQWLNAQYSTNMGVLPCDGIYQRDTNVGLIYALQIALGLAPDTANGTFGPQTDELLKSVSLSVGDTSDIVRILEYGLYLNGYYTGDFGTTYTTATANGVKAFSQFMHYDNPSTTANYTVIKGLVTSNGDTSRNSTAMDCATQLGAADVANMVSIGFTYVGRYLTGTVGTGENETPKFLTIPECQAIVDGGMRFFPIYEDGGYTLDYFTAAQGYLDANVAAQAAFNLRLPRNTVIYFAVDVDAQQGDIDSNILPYLKAVVSGLAISPYTAGVYGTRNVCLNAQSQAGYNYSFVANMSYGWSGNLGFKMPSNWAFDQFVEYTAYGIDIDQDAASGLDGAVTGLVPAIGLNATTLEQMSEIEAVAVDYIQDTGATLSVLKLVAEFYQHFRYGGATWTVFTGLPDDAWLTYCEQSTSITHDTQLLDLVDPISGNVIDLQHLMASLNALLSINILTTIFPIEDYAGWAGDLVTAAGQAVANKDKFSSVTDAAEYYIATPHTDSSFSVSDFLADIDAINLRVLSEENSDSLVTTLFDDYYSSDVSSRIPSVLTSRFGTTTDDVTLAALEYLAPADPALKSALTILTVALGVQNFQGYEPEIAAAVAATLLNY